MRGSNRIRELGDRPLPDACVACAYDAHSLPHSWVTRSIGAGGATMPCYLLHMIETPNANPYADPDIKDVVGEYPRLFCAQCTPPLELAPSESVRCLQRDTPVLARDRPVPPTRRRRSRQARPAASPLLRQLALVRPHEQRDPADEHRHAEQLPHRQAPRQESDLDVRLAEELDDDPERPRRASEASRGALRGTARGRASRATASRRRCTTPSSSAS